MSLLELSFEALKERRLRTALTIIMVMIGGSLIVAVNGISTGTVTFVNEQFSILGANLLVVTPRGQDFEITDAVIKDISRIDDVLSAVPFIQQVSTVSSRGKSQSIVVMGIDNDKLKLIFPSFSLSEGTIVQPSDRIGILLGYQVVYSKGEEEPFTRLDQTVKIHYRKTVNGESVILHKSFTVRGIMSYIGSGLVPVDQMAFISIEAANTLFGRGGEYDGIYVITTDPELNIKVSDEISEKYNVNILSPKTITDTINRVSSAISLFVGNIAAVSLLVASVGIITTLWTSMLERIREIGILKAIGFSNRKILTLFLNEAIIIGLIGGSVGLIFGVFLAYILKSFFQGEFAMINPIFLPETFINTWLLCLGLSAIAGFYPAWRASKLEAVSCLRHE